MNLEAVIQSEVRQKQKSTYMLKYIYMKSRKMVLMNLFTEKKWRPDIENEFVDTVGEGESRTN